MGVNEKLTLTESYIAAANLSAYQYHFVKLTSDRTVNICSAITDRPCGILLNKPDAANKEALVLVIGRCPLVSAEALTIGQLVNTETDGHGLICTPGSDTTTYIAASVVEVSGAVDQLAVVEVQCATLARAA